MATRELEDPGSSFTGPPSSKLNAECSHQGQAVGVADHPRLHPVVEGEFAVVAPVLEVDVDGPAAQPVDVAPAPATSEPEQPQTALPVEVPKLPAPLPEAPPIPPVPALPVEAPSLPVELPALPAPPQLPPVPPIPP